VSAEPGVLAIDAGQTAMKVRVQSRRGIHDELFPGIRTHEPLLPQLAAVVRAVLDGGASDVGIVAAGVSGLTARDADASALAALLGGTGIEHAVIAHDSTTSFLGALGDARGAVIAAGTGVVTLGVGRDAVARVDGWGNLIGDAGSGYWIGREALDAVMRAFDGRGSATALTAVARERWPDLSGAYIELQSADDRVRTIASFAAHVARLAESGDPVALDITGRAANELAHSTATALQLVRRDEESQEVCAIGGVFRSAPLKTAFAASLSMMAPHARLVEARGHGIDGAVAVAKLPSGHPLAGAISTAPVG